MTQYGEIDAMKKIEEALEPLEEAARARALQWAVSRFGISKVSGIKDAVVGRAQTRDVGEPASAAGFETFADLFEAARPSTERDKALVAGYWTQVCQNAGSFASQTLNTELKDLGHGVSNITEALTRLKSERPALALQLKKSGTSKQARKTYKLTQEGIRRVQVMIGGETAPEDSI